MKINPITVLLTLLFIIPILKGFIVKFSSRGIKRDISEVISDITFIFSLFMGAFYGRKIFVLRDTEVSRKIYNSIPRFIISMANENPIIIYVVLIPIIIFILYKLLNVIFQFVFSIILFPLLDKLENFLRSKGEAFQRLTGVLFQLPKAICYILIGVFLLNIASMFNKDQSLNKYLQQSGVYNFVCKEYVIPITKSKIAKQLPSIINNSFKIQIKDAQNNPDGKQIVYYNGVTIDEGIKSNKSIDSFAKRLCSNQSSVRGKAKVLYNWVGQNISYDENKANEVLNNNFNSSSGAIAAYNTRKGICFDYACLYTAMCRANGIKVRLITGEGFNGANWVGHAWNQVYLPEENRWINVDTTFYKGGNYFDNVGFEADHRTERIAGEW